MPKDIPKLNGLVDARVAQEITRVIENLYRYIDEKFKATEVINPMVASEVRRQIGLAMPLIEPVGDELATAGQEEILDIGDIPNLPTSKIVSGTFPLIRIPTNVLKTDDDLLITIGAVPVGGTITLKDNNGNSVDVLTP